MRRKGIAKGCFRLDGSKKWTAAKELDKPTAETARNKMISNKNGSLTDSIVRDFLGGSNAAANQAKAYTEVINNIKNGGKSRERSGSLAESARNRMLQRQEQNSNGSYPDIGKDRANRKAYPITNGK